MQNEILFRNDWWIILGVGKITKKRGSKKN